MAGDVLLLEKLDSIAIITLNRPERLNAQNRAVRDKLEQFLFELEIDDKIKVIIVTGSGEKAFSAGADIHEMVELSNKEESERLSNLRSWTWHLATCKKPTIAAINGLAYGGGALMASLTDIRVGCERSSFKFLSASYGRVNSTWSLPLIVGLPMAKELIFTGRVVGADEALRIGLLNRMFTSSDLMKGAVEMAQAIAANSPETVQIIKNIMNSNVGKSLEEMMINEMETVTNKLKVPPPQESFKNFLERKTQ